jgi:hypothetical protein
MDDHESVDVRAIAALLETTERAHGEYETTELNGVYDQDWARWYAAYAVEHGIGELTGREIGVDELANALTEGFAAFEATDPRPAEGWAAFIAERIGSGR